MTRPHAVGTRVRRSTGMPKWTKTHTDRPRPCETELQEWEITYCVKITITSQIKNLLLLFVKASKNCTNINKYLITVTYFGSLNKIMTYVYISLRISHLQASISICIAILELQFLEKY